MDNLKELIIYQIHTNLIGLDTSFKFTEMGFGHLFGVKDFRKYVNSFTYTNHSGQETQRFSREEVEKLLKNEDALNELAKVATLEKYENKRKIRKLKHNVQFEDNIKNILERLNSPYSFNGICFEGELDGRLKPSEKALEILKKRF